MAFRLSTRIRNSSKESQRFYGDPTDNSLFNLVLVCQITYHSKKSTMLASITTSSQSSAPNQPESRHC